MKTVRTGGITNYNSEYYVIEELYENGEKVHEKIIILDKADNMIRDIIIK